MFKKIAKGLSHSALESLVSDEMIANALRKRGSYMSPQAAATTGAPHDFEMGSTLNSELFERFFRPQESVYTKEFNKGVPSPYLGFTPWTQFSARNPLSVRLSEVLANEEFDDEFLEPSRDVLDFMKFLLEELCQEFGSGILGMAFVPDGRGGLTATIRRAKKVLQIIAPARLQERGPYMFFKDSTSHGIREISTAGDLFRRISWVLS